MMTSWKNEKKRLKEAERMAQYEANQAEAWRKETLSMWERINESDASDDVKEILHLMAQHMGL